MKHMKIFLWDELDAVNANYGRSTSLGLQTDAARAVARPCIVLVTKKKFGEPAFPRYLGLAKGRGIGSC
ncbi:MAG: hypothetical protein ABIG94_07100 [Pseudomonadota bacterium]